MLNIDFSPTYVPTIGVEVLPITINTNNTTIKFNIWDVAGQDRFYGIRDGYFIQANCAIIMLSDNKQIIKNCQGHIRDIRRVCGNIPIIYVFNKSELDKTIRIHNQFVQKDYINSNNVFMCSCVLLKIILILKNH